MLKLKKKSVNFVLCLQYFWKETHDFSLKRLDGTGFPYLIYVEKIVKNKIKVMPNAVSSSYLPIDMSNWYQHQLYTNYVCVCLQIHIILEKKFIYIYIYVYIYI